MTHITLNLAEILSQKLQFGVTVPVSVDVEHFLEYADDDWEFEYDLDAALDAEEMAAVIFTAEDAKRVRPHLTDTQAWEVARITRNDFAYAVEDFLGDVADINFPSTRQKLERRLATIRAGANARTPSDPLTCELFDAQRLLERLFAGAEGNPALEGFLSAALDDLERAAETSNSTEA